MLALSEWRIVFRIDGADPRRVLVTEVRSGYRARELSAHPLHLQFSEAAFS